MGILDGLHLDAREKGIIIVAAVLSFVMAMRRGPNDRPGDSPFNDTVFTIEWCKQFPECSRVPVLTVEESPEPPVI